MRVRKLLSAPKLLTQDSGKWSTKDLPPRWCPINAKSRPIRGGWHWRAAKVQGGSDEYVLVAQCHPAKGNWKSFLILDTVTGPAVVARYEDHGSHPGVHVHSHCDRSGLEVGPTSMDGLARVPAASSWHRRTLAWTQEGFWKASLKFFRVGSGAPEPMNNDLFGTF